MSEPIHNFGFDYDVTEYRKLSPERAAQRWIQNHPFPGQDLDQALVTLAVFQAGVAAGQLFGGDTEMTSRFSAAYITAIARRAQTGA